MVDLTMFGIITGLALAWYMVWLRVVSVHDSVLASERAYVDAVGVSATSAGPLPFEPSWGSPHSSGGVKSAGFADFAAQPIPSARAASVPARIGGNK